MTKAEFVKIMAYLSAGYGGKEIPPATADVYWDLLNDLPASIVLAAVKKVLVRSEYPSFPTVGALRKAATGLLDGHAPTATDAWGEVLAAVRKYGYYREAEALASMSPEVAHVVKCIGWQEICASEEPDVVRGQFRVAYERFVERRQEERALTPDLKQMLEPGKELQALEDGVMP